MVFLPPVSHAGVKKEKQASLEFCSFLPYFLLFTRHIRSVTSGRFSRSATGLEPRLSAPRFRVVPHQRTVPPRSRREGIRRDCGPFSWQRRALHRLFE